MARRLIELVDMVRRQVERIRPMDELYLPPIYFDFGKDCVVRLQDGCVEFRAATDGGLHAAFLAAAKQARSMAEGEVALRISAAPVAGRPGWNHAYPVQVVSNGASK